MLYLGTRWTEWSASSPGRLIHGERAPAPNGQWPLRTLWTRNISLPCQEPKSSSSPQSRHYSDRVRCDSVVKQSTVTSVTRWSYWNCGIRRCTPTSLPLWSRFLRQLAMSADALHRGQGQNRHFIPLGLNSHKTKSSRKHSICSEKKSEVTQLPGAMWQPLDMACVTTR